MFETIKEWLTANKIPFSHLHHAPTRTSEESANIRGEALKTGGKALVIKVDDTFYIFVLSASKQLDSSMIKKYFSAKKIRFASKDELMDLTGLVPGSVPPFGNPILDLKLYVDPSVINNPTINFNAGSLTNSLTLSITDYLDIAKPTIFNFSKS